MQRINLAAALLWLAAASAAHATIALDATGSITNVSVTNTSTIATTTYTATSSNDIIIASVTCDHNTTPPTVTGVAGGSLTWTQRATGIKANTRLSVWYAVASGAFSSTVTATFSGACGTPALLVFAVSGANTTTPWDANGSLPAVNTGAAGSTPTVTGVSTSKTNTMLLSSIGGQSNFSGTISGWTTVSASFNAGGCCFAGFHESEKVVSAKQSSLTAAYSGTTNQWVMIVDALVDASQPASGSLMLKSGPGW